jgi:hypothetical protein
MIQAAVPEKKKIIKDVFLARKILQEDQEYFNTNEVDESVNGNQATVNHPELKKIVVELPKFAIKQSSVIDHSAMTLSYIHENNLLGNAEKMFSIQNGKLIRNSICSSFC